MLLSLYLLFSTQTGLSESLLCFVLVGLVFGALPLEPHLQVHFALVFLEMGGLMNYLPGLASNCNPPGFQSPK
jgi:hypothetical protein